MKQIFRQVTLVVASLLMVGGLAVVPVSAEHGGNRTETVATTESDDDTTVTTNATTSTNAETETGDDASSQSGKLRAQAKQLLQDKRKNAKQHTESQRQKACVQRQKSIDKRAANFGTAAQRHLDVFNKIFTRVQAFQTDKQLNVADYDALVATATTKQAAAQSAVDALKALDVQIDCTQADPASTVAALKTAVSDARKALQAYRSAIKDVTVALKGASTAQNTTDTTGGEQ